MQVILNQNVQKLGYRGDIVNVKPGYYQNYLAPKGIAVLGTPALLKVAAARKQKLVMQKQQVLENAKDVLDKLKGLTVMITAKASDKGKLYGSVTEEEVASAIGKASKMDFDRSFVKMEHIKTVGEHTVNVHLGEGFDAKVTVVIASEAL